YWALKCILQIARPAILVPIVLAQLLDPPCTDPYARWCGRGGAARPPPIPINPLIEYRDGTNNPETNGTSFTFLGFTHIWGKSRAGKNVVRQVTAKNRYARALAAVTAWCRHNRHQPIPDQHAHLTAMMRGHYAYYGITGNFRRLSWYAHQVA